MVLCSAYQCKSRSEKKEPGITFHRFPTDPQKNDLWIKNMKIEDWKPTKNSRLCSNHFEKNCFYRTGTDQVRLLAGAIPTIFVEIPSYLQPKKIKKRPLPREFSTEPVASTSRDIVQQQEEESPRKKVLRRKLFHEVKKSRDKTNKIRVLGQKLQRYKRKVVSLEQIIKDLKDQNLLTSENSLLFDNMPQISKELLKRKNVKRMKYSPELRKVAITLNFLSPKAYDYVRRIFDTCLPHKSTIGKWFKNVNAAPGFTSESFETLKKHVELSNKPTLLSLVIDEMSIRKQVEWDGTKFHGYVHFGVDLEDDTNAVAKDAFVLMLVAINGRWKVPVGYFFTDGLNGDQKAELVTQCIQLTAEAGAEIVSLTFDGAPSNITMANILGCKTSNVFEIKPYFSFNGKNIYIFYDPCHMLKLVRNAFGERKVFLDDEGNIINWKFIEKLQQLQECEGLHLGNKLRKAHIHFFKQKMKVRLAVQLLSESVADSISYCEKELGLEEFNGCQGTVKFISIMNKIFDVLNSRSLVSPQYKKALYEKNIGITREFVETAISYILNLKLSDNTLVVNSKRKTGFVGLIVSLKSTLSLYDELIVQQNKLKYFPVYKVSQDHIELFFSSIRSRGGWNNNPTARQFTAAYKRLLVRAEIREGGMGNCIPLDDIPILVGSSRLDKPVENISYPHWIEELPATPLEAIWSDHDYIMNSHVISECSYQIIIYIAGFVTHQLQNSIRCEQCVDSLIGDKENFLTSLITKKTHGGLTYPSKDVIYVCKTSEHFLRINENTITKPNAIRVLKSKIMYQCIQNSIFQCLQEHVLENTSNHIYFLIECIIIKYLNIRIHFITKRLSEKVDPIRSHFTKLIHFKGQ